MLVQAQLACGPRSDWLSLLVQQTSTERMTLLAEAGELAGYPVLSASEHWPLQPDFGLVSYVQMTEYGLFVGRDEQGRLCAAMSAPVDGKAAAFLARSNLALHELYVADPLALTRALEAYESGFSAMTEAIGVDQVIELGRDASADMTLSSIQEEASPAVRLLDSTVFDALRAEASDIHLESIPQGVTVKFRIDGVLNQVATVANPALAEQVVARIKVLAGLDIAEKRVPQDGRFRVAAKGRDIDIRVSIIPGIHGEDAVLRILDKQALIDHVQGLTLASLGFDHETVRSIRRLASEPYGMMLVTGPTGSGKTTTLYAALTEINHGEDKTITIEDPVEYQLPGVLQIPVNEKKGLTFAVGLRSILRHDPDKILVGEIRDPETAQIAVQAALTGHLVLTSVHANNTFDVIGRFLHMGVDPYSFVSSLTGVVAQRLVRVNCPRCVRDVTVAPEILQEAGITDAHAYRFRAGAGCVYCRGTGFKGRRAIAEVLRLNDEMREQIIARASILSLKQLARRQGTRFLRDVSLELVRNGETTLEEVNRVSFVA
jgi:general secretion pathway protein E